MKTNSVGYTIGVYPCVSFFHQRSEREEKDFWRQLSETPDVPRPEQSYLENLHPSGDQWLSCHMSGNWKFIVTVVMETMRRRSKNNGFGPASSDEEQRQACVTYYRHLSNKTNSLQVNKMLVLEPQVTPLTTNPNAMQATSAPAHSLKEIISWDRPCKLALEYYGIMASSSPRKGFLPLENVLEVITDYDISICINWACSVTEGCSTTLPLTHTQMAKQAGRLDALMSSGTTLSGAYGEWQDLHIPFAPLYTESLMIMDHARELSNATESLTLYFAGIRLPEINAATDMHHRVKILCSGIHFLSEFR